MELETSTAIIISTPSRSTSRSLEPSCGRAIATASNASAVKKNTALLRIRVGEASGMSSASVCGLPKRSSLLRRDRTANRYTAVSSGIAANRYK